MSAGAAATVADSAITSHHIDPTLPHQPRPLTRSERTRRETLVYHSPRNNRIVTLADAVTITLGLKLEFDSTLAVFVERPRRIALSPKQQIDLSFWTRSHSGEERYYLAIPSAGTVGSTSGAAAIRGGEALQEAAQRHGIEIHFVTEKELVSASAMLGAYWQLLPHVQHHRRLSNRVFVQAGIRALLALVPRTTLKQLVQQLGDRYPSDQVQAVVAAMIHDGSLRILEPAGFSQDSILEVMYAA